MRNSSNTPARHHLIIVLFLIYCLRCGTPHREMYINARHMRLIHVHSGRQLLLVCQPERIQTPHENAEV